MTHKRFALIVLAGIGPAGLACSRADRMAGKNAACVGALLIALLLLLILAASAPDIWKWWK